jgi:hypothetical protein
MLQVCSIWLLKMCIGSIVPELKTSSCFVFFLRGNYLNRYAAILSKRIFGFFYFSAVHYIFYAKPWHKRMSFHLG